MSGEKSFEVLEKIFVAKNKKNIEEIQGYTIKYGNIVDFSNNDEIIDEVLVSFFKAPKSYTTENMCEINSHGGTVVVKKILDLCLKNGAILAEPGEFTKRAFLNGRIDLSQAESVIDIINAKSDKEAKEGIKQLEGYLSNKIRNIKNDLLEIMTNIEVSIDYPEYDTPEVSFEDLRNKFKNIKTNLINLEKSFDNGKLIKEGIKTVIIGKPNVGKSSLLNYILKEDRAIVTEYEGTTRDTIEEFININGIPLKIVDTAGIRQTSNEVEKIGIEKSMKMAENADLIICILDTSRELEEEDFKILKLAKEKKNILLLNKMDLEAKFNENSDYLKDFNNIIKISAIKQEGIETLYDKISEMFNLSQIELSNEVIITNQRHKNLIVKAIENLNEAENTLKKNMPIDFIEIYLKNVLVNLGSITGEEASEEIINEIFSRFCLGK